MSDLKPCPFCNEQLTLMENQYGERIYEHPANDCIAEDIYVSDDGDDVERWNTRALPHQDGLGADAIERLLKKHTRVGENFDIIHCDDFMDDVRAALAESEK